MDQNPTADSKKSITSHAFALTSKFGDEHAQLAQVNVILSIIYCHIC